LQQRAGEFFAGVSISRPGEDDASDVFAIVLGVSPEHFARRQVPQSK